MELFKKVITIVLLITFIGTIGVLANKYPIIYIIIFALFLIHVFLKDNHQSHLSTVEKIKYIFKSFKSWLHKNLFANKIKDRIFPWMVLISITVNFVIQPLATLSHRTPKGDVNRIPEVYVDKWVDDEDPEMIVTLTLYKDKMKYTQAANGEKPYIDWCAPDRIYYDFSNLEYLHRYKFWYTPVKYFSLLFIPNTIFGVQKISWNCSDGDNITTTEPFENENGYEMMLGEQYIKIGHGDSATVFKDVFWLSRK